MRYHNITTNDMLNGEGLRTVLWLAGCDHKCKGCQNPITWSHDGGLIFDAKAKEELYTYLREDWISGITFSGGDPLSLRNRYEVLELIREIRLLFPEKSVWLYTGFVWDRIKDLPGIENIDVVVDGPFIDIFKDVNYPWAGSTNQFVINVKESLKHGMAVLYFNK